MVMPSYVRDEDFRFYYRHVSDRCAVPSSSPDTGTWSLNMMYLSMNVFSASWSSLAPHDS